MGGFFNLDGPFYKFGNLIADIVILSLLWIVFSLPIFTIGASTTAVYYVMTRRIADKEKYLFKDFFESFKRNFKTATLAFLTIFFLFTVLIINIMNIDVVGDMKPFMLPFQYCFFIETVLITIFIFPILSRFDMKYRTLFKTAFFMANRHMLTSVFCLLILLAVALLTYLTGAFFLVAAGTYCFLTSYLFMRRFKKYRPEMDAEIDYEALREKLKEENAAKENGEYDGAEAVFSDAAGLLIEKQSMETKTNAKDKGKRNK